MGRFNVIHILETDAQEIDLFTGLVTEEKCAQLFAHWIDIETSVDTAFICGPEPMMLGIAAALRTHGTGRQQIKFELFASAQPGRAKRKAVATDRCRQCRQSGHRSDHWTARPRPCRWARILTDSGEPLWKTPWTRPYACKAGVCSTCRCKVIEGEVEMIANHALEDYEVEKGYVLSCQSFPVTDRVVVDYDQ